MRRILTLLLLTAVASGARGQQLDPKDYIYPLRDLKQRLYSANFGEIRPGHFHAGVDIKTDAEEGKPGRGRGRRLRFARGIAGGRLRTRRLPHAPQRHDGRLRPPPAFPQRHRAARAQETLRPPFERREPLVRSRKVAREAGRHGGLLGRQRFVGRARTSITKSATRRPSGSTTPSARESSAPRTNIRRASCACTTSRSTPCRACRAQRSGELRRGPHGRRPLRPDARRPVGAGRRGYFVAEVTDRRNDVWNTFGVWRSTVFADGVPLLRIPYGRFT